MGQKLKPKKELFSGKRGAYCSPRDICHMYRKIIHAEDTRNDVSGPIKFLLDIWQCERVLGY